MLAHQCCVLLANNVASCCFGGNRKVHKSSFVEIAGLFRVFYIILFLAKPLVEISQNFPSRTGVVCVKSLLSEVSCRNLDATAPVWRFRRDKCNTLKVKGVF